MTAKEFRQEQEYEWGHFQELTSTGIDPNYVNIEKFAEDYHKAQLKLLGIADVVGSADTDEDTSMTDEEIEWHLDQERKAKKAGMTREQILNGEHHDIIF